MKRILSFLLALAMVICLLPVRSLQTRAAEVTQGDGSAENPWLIYSEADYVAHIFTNTDEGKSGKVYYKLMADIVLDGTSDDDVDGNKGGSSTGRAINIDFNGHTVTADGTAYRFFACGAAGDLTLKNGSVIVDRTYVNKGAVFYIFSAGKLTLENMNISEIGTKDHTNNGELLCIESGAIVSIKDTVMEAETDGNTYPDRTVYITGQGSTLTFQDSDIKENVYVASTGSLIVSGATKIANVDLTSGALADVSGLSAGANVRVAAGDAAFTGVLENAEKYLAYVHEFDAAKKVAVVDNTLVLVDEVTGDGSAEKPWLIASEADYVEHIYTNKTENGYYKIKADIVLNVSTNDGVNGNVGYTSTGRTINIDFNGHTVSANGSAYRFFSCGAAGDLTLKNGFVSVNRKYVNNGAVFNIFAGGKLTLENMNISEIGTTAHTGLGELLFVNDGSTAIITNTVMEAETAGNTNLDKTVYVNDSNVTFQDSTINENVYATSTGSITVSGNTTVTEINLTSGALLTVGELDGRARIGINAKENTPFTGDLGDNAETYAACFKAADSAKIIKADSNNCLILTEPETTLRQFLSECFAFLA